MSQSVSRLQLAAAIALATCSVAAVADDAIRLDTGQGNDTPYVRKDSDSVAIREGSPQSGTKGGNEQAPGISSDGEALAMLEAINDHEIETAALAQRKGVSASLQAFARDLEREHRANQFKTRRVGEQGGINPFESDDVKVVRQRAAAERQMLEGLSGAEFEVAFVDAMVQLNADAVTVVDQSLLPASKNSGVQDHLRVARERFADNLDRANALVPQAQAAR